MPLGYSLSARDPVVSIKKEIESALPNERKRLDRARVNLDFYNGAFDKYPVRPPSNDYEATGKPRRSLIMQRIVNVLTAHLYAEGPKRTLPDHPEATDWLDRCYRANAADARWMHADRMTCVTDCAAWQAVPGDDERPVRLVLWDGSQFCVWEDPDDATKPMAVAVIDLYNEQRRLRLYTAETVTTFMTKEWRVGMTSGGTAYRQAKEEPNTFGFLPFAFVHFTYPAADFWTTGPGDYLQAANENMDVRLTRIADSIYYNLMPITVFKNTPIGWRPRTPIKPGDAWYLTAAPDEAGENGGNADASYLQADSAFVAAGWDDFNSYLDHVYEVLGIPKAFVRMDQDSVRSGASLVAEQEPLLKWAQSRQRMYACYENDLARLVLRVGAKHLGRQDYGEYQATAAQLLAAADDPAGLTLRWPKHRPELYGAERDDTDGWLMENRLGSRTTVLMDREGLTREEAEQRLEEIAEDLQKEHEIFGDLEQAETEREADKAKTMAEATAPPEEQTGEDDAGSE